MAKEAGGSENSSWELLLSISKMILVLLMLGVIVTQQFELAHAQLPDSFRERIVEAAKQSRREEENNARTLRLHEANRLRDELESELKSRSEEELDLESSLATLASLLQEFQRRNQLGGVLPNGGELGSGLSWRVHLLPLLGEKELYDQFNLNEPWNSEHNQLLISKCPKVFLGTEAGKTRIRSFLNVDGEGWPFLVRSDLLDTPSETIAVFGAASDAAIEWTRPDDLDGYVGVDAIGKLLQVKATAPGESSGQRTNPCRVVLTCDMVLRRLFTGTTAEQFRAMVTHEQQEIIGGSTLDNYLHIDFVFETNGYSQGVGSKGNPREIKSKIERIGKAIEKYREAVARDSSLLERQEGWQLSWRVQLLPYLGEERLYRKFKLNEPWNSANNLKLLAEIPEVYRLGTRNGQTRFCTPGNIRRNESPLLDILDRKNDEKGATVFFFFTGPEKSCPWTQLDEIVADSKDFSGSLGWEESESIPSCTTTGQYLLLPPRLHRSKINALLTSIQPPQFDVPLALARPERILKVLPEVSITVSKRESIELPKVAAVKLSEGGETKIDVKDEGRLRKVVIALLNENAIRQAPIWFKKGEGVPQGLSWRVHLLPFLGESSLYAKFALQEPWDSPKNLAAAAEIPEVFRSRGIDDGKTDICAFSGEETFLGRQSWSLPFPNTRRDNLLLVQVGDERRVPWTKPEDVQLDESFKLSEFFGSRRFLLMARGDGVVMPFAATLPEQLFFAMATSRKYVYVDGPAVRRLSLHTLGLPVVQLPNKMRSEGDRLRIATQAFREHHRAYGMYPPASSDIRSATKMPLEHHCLSWRVHILPYIGYDSLYAQFRRDEPWDSPHNRQFLSCMPDVFRDEEDSVNSFTTRMQIVVGEGCPFADVGEAPSRGDLVDGASDTLQILIAPPERAVPWTQPLDYEVDLATSDFKDLRGGDGLLFTTFDGIVRRLPPGFEVRTLRSLLTVNGGEEIDRSKVLYGK